MALLAAADVVPTARAEDSVEGLASHAALPLTDDDNVVARRAVSRAGVLAFDGFSAFGCRASQLLPAAVGQGRMSPVCRTRLSRSAARIVSRTFCEGAIDIAC